MQNFILKMTTRFNVSVIVNPALDTALQKTSNYGHCHLCKVLEGSFNFAIATAC